MRGKKYDAALYLRVSTEDQAREGVSLAMQEDRLRAYCAARDWTVAAVYRDEGYSGKDLNRPRLQNLLSYVKRGGSYQVVLVYKLDRLTRSVRDLGTLLEAFERSGTALVSLTESLDATTATGRLLVNIIGSVAQWEREQIGERTSAALQHKKRNGEYTGGGTPYGYRKEAGPVGVRVFADEQEQAVISWIRSHRNHGRTVAAITRLLNDNGMLRRGRRWHREQVRRIIKEGERSFQ